MLKLCYTQHATTKVLARVHTSTACMHMSDNLLPLKQHICPALSPAESSRASLLPLSFEMLCAAACSITASISCPAAANNQARAKAPPTRGSFRPPEPQLPSLPEVVKESRPLTATKCCGRQVAHRHQPRTAPSDIHRLPPRVSDRPMRRPWASGRFWPRSDNQVVLFSGGALPRGGLAAVWLGLSP